MIFGIGLDMIENKRMEAAVSDVFLKRVFTAREIKMLKDRGLGIQQISGGWAGKEAAIKAFGDYGGSASFKEIEVLRANSGKPVIEFTGATAILAEELGINKTHITITNLKELVAAMVVFEKDGT